jgi:hypothetical protein
MMLTPPDHLRSPRQVTLVALARENRYWQPTEGRWLSFRWSVVNVEVVE